MSARHSQRNGLTIAMWSGPRNISTAMMRAFENRPDTLVWDEPLYSYYLKTTALPHPMADQIIAAGQTRWEDVAETATGPIPDGMTVWYQKHMTQHLLHEVDREWIHALTNCFLIREPAKVAASYARKRPNVSVAALGFVQQAELFQRIRDATGTTPIVIESSELLRNPRAGMKMLCKSLGLEFNECMLSWPRGLRESDGVWASHWYDAVADSTCFAPYIEKFVELSPALLSIAEACQPHYDLLFENRMSIPPVDSRDL